MASGLGHPARGTRAHATVPGAGRDAAAGADGEDQAASGAAALLPALLGGFKKQAQAQPTGLDGLAGMLGGLGGGGQGGLSGLTSLLDLDRDGNQLDDILGMAGKLTRS